MRHFYYIENDLSDIDLKKENLTLTVCNYDSIFIKNLLSEGINDISTINFAINAVISKEKGLLSIDDIFA